MHCLWRNQRSGRQPRKRAAWSSGCHTPSNFGTKVVRLAHCRGCRLCFYRAARQGWPDATQLLSISLPQLSWPVFEALKCFLIRCWFSGGMLIWLAWWGRHFWAWFWRALCTFGSLLARRRGRPRSRTTRDRQSSSERCRRFGESFRRRQGEAQWAYTSFVSMGWGSRSWASLPLSSQCPEFKSLCRSKTLWPGWRISGFRDQGMDLPCSLRVSGVTGTIYQHDSQNWRSRSCSFSPRRIRLSQNLSNSRLANCRLHPWLPPGTHSA